MWLVNSPQVADVPELISTWCCRCDGCWETGITNSELQTSLGFSGTLLPNSGVEILGSIIFTYLKTSSKISVLFLSLRWSDWFLSALVRWGVLVTWASAVVLSAWRSDCLSWLCGQRWFLLLCALVLEGSSWFAAFATTYPMNLSWPVQAEFQECSVLSVCFPSYSISLCLHTVSLGLGLQNEKKIGGRTCRI